MKVIDFFSGCGGASEGLRQAGLDITIGLDFDIKAAETYQANFPEALFYNVDIRELDEKELAKAFKEKNREKNHFCLLHVPHVSHSLHKINQKVKMIFDVHYWMKHTGLSAN